MRNYNVDNMTSMHKVDNVFISVLLKILLQPLVLDQDCMTLSSRDLRLEKRTLFR